MTDGAIVELQPAPAQAPAVRRIRVFVAMSFRDEEEPALVDYFEAMKRAAASTGLPIELVRIDLVEREPTWSSIRETGAPFFTRTLRNSRPPSNQPYSRPIKMYPKRSGARLFNERVIPVPKTC